MCDFSPRRSGPPEPRYREESSSLKVLALADGKHAAQTVT
jgi:hypothetical protein